MSRKKLPAVVMLALVLLLALAPTSIGAGQEMVSPNSVDWGKVARYAECGVAVYFAVQTGGAMAWFAGFACLQAFMAEPDWAP